MAIKYLDARRIRGSSTAGSPDTLGSAGDATSNGSDLVTSGQKLGTGCLNFDGSSDYIDAYSGLQNAMNTTGSISIWFNADVDEDAILIAFCNSGANTKMEVTTRSNRKIGMQLKVGGTQQWEVSSDTLYNASGWNHVVFTHNGTLPEIYINGSLATMTRASTTDNTKWWTALRSAGANGIAIGSKAPLNGNSQNEHFDGQLDDIGIWNRVLTSTEVGNLYNSGTGVLATTIPSDLKVYYNCDSATVTNNAVITDEKATLITASSASDWTLSASEFTIANDLLNATDVGSGTIRQATYPLGLTVGTTFVLRFSYKPKSSALNIYPLAITNGTTQINSNSTGYGIKGNGGTQLTLFGCTGNASLTQSSYITSLSVNTQYYIELINDDSNVTMKIFTGSDYSTGQVGSTVSITDQNFTTINTLQSCGRADGSDGTDNSYEVGDINFYNSQTSATTVTKNIPFSASTDLPENTLFEQTDNYKYYFLQSNAWVRTGGEALSTALTNTSDFTISTTTNTNDSATRNASGAYDSSWAYQASAITADSYLEYYINDSLVYTSGRFNSGTYYAALGSDRNSDGVKWQLLNNTAAYVEWKLIAFTGNVYSSNIGVHSSTSRPAWFQQKAFFFIGSGSPNTVQVVEYDGSSADYAWTKSPAATPVVGDTFKIVMRS